MNLSQQIQAAQIDFAYGKLPVAIGANLINALLLVFFLQDSAPHIVLYLWFAGVAAISAWRFLLLRNYREVPSQPATLKARRLCFIASSTAAGLMWGIAGYYLFPEQDFSGQMLLVFVISGMSAAASNTLSTLNGAYPAFLLAAGLPLAAKLFSLGGNYVAMGILCLAYIGAMLMITRFTKGVIAEVLSLRFKNLDLIDSLRHEIQAKQKAEHTVRDSQQRLSLLVERSPLGVIEWDNDFRVASWNAAAESIFGYSREEAVGRHARSLIIPESMHASVSEIWCDLLAQNGGARSTNDNLTKDGRIITCEWYNVPLVDMSGQVIGVASMVDDVSQRKDYELRLRQLAHFDLLTGLPNRALLSDRMRQAMAHALREQKLLAVCYMDLDGFKPVNDAMGHTAGDKLLAMVAERLKQCIRSEDTVARIGGDEFVLLLGDLESDEECRQAMDRIHGIIAQPYVIQGELVSISAGIGVTLYPHDDMDADTLLRHADQSMYTAKEFGRNRYHIYDPDKDLVIRSNRARVERIEQALESDEFCLYYQPKINMRTGELIGVEALIRWQHPEQGVLPPAEFLPYVEGGEFDFVLCNWVIGTALQQIACWQSQGCDIPVSVNISPGQLLHPQFMASIHATLARHSGVSPSMLELEVLETTALEDIIKVNEIMQECQAIGISFAVDDFGTGYSSLTYLKQLPARTLKIDQTFVRDMLVDSTDLDIVEAVIGLGRAFQRHVIAEGVETAEHGLSLLQLGCELAQGYGIARPMPPENLLRWLMSYEPDPRWELAGVIEFSAVPDA